MSCCLSSKFGGWCSRSETKIAKDGNEYCIYHMPLEEKWLTGNEFHLKLYSYIDRMIDGHGECILNGTVFPQNTQFFHYNNTKPLPRISFVHCVFGHVNFSGVKFGHDVDFSGSIFNGRTDFRDTYFNNSALFCEIKLNNYIIFENAHFKETVWFKYCSLKDCNFNGTEFHGDVDFERTIFTGLFDCSKAIFHGASNFCTTLYNDYSIFDSAVFSNSCHFNQSRFRNKAIFYNAKFESNADFTLTYFDRYVNFTDSSFLGSLKFSKSTFKHGFEFNNSIFKNGLSFENSEIAGQCNFWSSKFTTSGDVLPIDFGNTTVEDRIKLVNCDLTNFKTFNVDIKMFSFESCQFPLDSEGNFKIFEDTGKSGHDKDIILESVYRNFKLSAKKDNNEIMTSAWHYKEKEVQLRKLKHDSLEILFDIPKEFRSNSIQLFLHKFIGNIPCKINTLFETLVLFMYDCMSGFGEKPFRAGLVLLLLLFVPILFPAPSNNIGHIKAWLFYIPLGKIDLPVNEQIRIDVICVLLRMLMYILITIQVTVFGFSLRNKFRR